MERTDAQKNNGYISEFSAMLSAHPVLTSILWSGVFLALLGMSFALGIVPKLDTETKGPDIVLAEEKAESGLKETENAMPRRIVVERLGINAPIENPESRTIEALDAALLKGVVRYPGSGDLEDVSNMFLFGHSTGFRVVQNEAFKAFNGLKNAQQGDLIRVQSDTKEYVYRVTDVSLVDANEALVSLSSSEKKLTLTTCNSFGAKEERYVVEASFVGSYALPNGS